MFHPDDRATIADAHGRLIGTAEHEDITVRTKYTDGLEPWTTTRMRISSYPGDLGEHLAVVDMYRD